MLFALLVVAATLAVGAYFYFRRHPDVAAAVKAEVKKEAASETSRIKDGKL